MGEATPGGGIRSHTRACRQDYLPHLWRTGRASAPLVVRIDGGAAPPSGRRFEKPGRRWASRFSGIAGGNSTAMDALKRGKDRIDDVDGSSRQWSVNLI